jgi:ATP-dependent DNA helicase RecG
MEALKNSPLRDNFESLTNHSMPSLKQALEILHHPKEGENLVPIEAFKHIAQPPSPYSPIFSSVFGQYCQSMGKPNVFDIKDNLSNQLHQHLGFALTNAQQRSIADINADLSSNHPMLRLLQGDVGSGKTTLLCNVFECFNLH